MLHCSIYPAGSLTDLKFTVVIARMGDQWLFARHRDRKTWESAGGHIEPGESPLDCARRELREETGAEEFDLSCVFDYHGWDRNGASDGRVYFAQVTRLGKLPDSEMAEVRLFDEIPANLTYPLVTPVLARRALFLSRAGTAVPPRVPPLGWGRGTENGGRRLKRCGVSGRRRVRVHFPQLLAAESAHFRRACRRK